MDTTNLTASELMSLAHRENACLVLPSLDHALVLWKRVVDLYGATHRADRLHVSHTGIGCWEAHRILRLWVPYPLDPTMPLDWPNERKGFRLVTFNHYYTKGELRGYSR